MMTKICSRKHSLAVVHVSPAQNFSYGGEGRLGRKSEAIIELGDREMGNWASALCKNDQGCMTNNSVSEELESYYPVRPECRDDMPKTRFKPRAGRTLSRRRWEAAFANDGHLDMAGVLKRIQRGGVHPSIKGEVWEFLLGCFDPNSTFEERKELRQQRRVQYDAWKSECQKLVPIVGSGKFSTSPIITDDGLPVQGTDGNDNPPYMAAIPSDTGILDKKVKQWVLTLPQIGLDVVRTDRALAFYENEMNQAKLWDILAIYAWMDKDIGYVQGMNDICSPMVILLENEADAFWCFERAMRRLRENFRSNSTSLGVRSQLSILAQIIKVVDPKLHQHLEDLDGGECLFAIRMVMVLFRREVSFIDSLYLWEVMWAMEYNPNIYLWYEEQRESIASNHKSGVKINGKQLKLYGEFEKKCVKTGGTEERGSLVLFLVASVLETKNKRLLKEAKGLDDVVQILGELTGNLDAKKALKSALKIHSKYLIKAKRL